MYSTKNWKISEKSPFKTVVNWTSNDCPDKKKCVPGPGNGDKCSILWSPNGYPDKKIEYQKLAIGDSMICNAAAPLLYL